MHIWIWFFVVILLTIVEMLTVNLVAVWFVVSALLALIASLYTDSFVVQFVIFIIVGIVLLFTTRPFFLKFLQKKTEKTNYDRIIGMRGIVMKDISKDYLGEVKINSQIWTATSEDTLEMMHKAEVIEIKGNTLVVKGVK